MKKVFLIIIFPLLTWSQEVSFVSKSLLEADTFIGVDSYDSTYFIKEGVLYKKTENEILNFNELQLGEISSVDIVNPLNLVVFYSDFNTVVFLDNHLNEIERLNFSSNVEFRNITTATLAGNNNLWTFNIDSQQLELYNYRSRRISVATQPFDGALISQSSDFNYCFILTEEKIRVFNIYGSLLYERDSERYEKIVQHNQNLIGLKQNELFYLPENTMSESKIDTPEINIKDLQLTQDFLYIYDGNYIHTFTLTFSK